MTVKPQQTTIEMTVQGMDCSDCVRHVRQAIENLEGVQSVDVLLSSQKAIVQFDPERIERQTVYKAVEGAGYKVIKPNTTLELTVHGMDCSDCVRHVRQAIEKMSGVESVEVFLASQKAVVELDPTQVNRQQIVQAVQIAGYSVAEPTTILEVSVNGMDCSDCARHVQQALEKLDGVESVEPFVTSKKVVVKLNPVKLSRQEVYQAIEGAGYSVADQPKEPRSQASIDDITRPILTLFGIVIGAVLFVVLVGERLGLFESLTARVPWFVGTILVLAGGYPLLINVVRAALKNKITSHTLMTAGLIAALVVGQWATAAVVVFFMYLGEYVERFTTERARRAVTDLESIAPRMARVERGEQEVEVPISQVAVGEIVVVRPGEQIPVDGEVISGQATVNQAAITGESMPIEARSGTNVFAATLASLGSLRIRATAIGADTTFGRVIKLVEEAEARRADVQRIADKFSAYYLPVVLGVAALTFAVRRDPLATAAVMIVACSCSFALATPIAMLASVGAGAKRGLLIKGGKYLESLARADVLLIDKTGTLTLGRPQITDVVPLSGVSETDVLSWAACAERYSEHPLAQAVLTLAEERNAPLNKPEQFEAFPGMGVQALVDGHVIAVGNHRMIPGGASLTVVKRFEEQGKTMLFVARDGELVGVLAATDAVRTEVPTAIAQVRKLQLKQIELLTGDNERTAAALAGNLGIRYRANLLPEDKIAIVREYQAKGHTVVMVGDGVNDAPALAQADIGIAMGAAGTSVAIEAAHIALMRDDWQLVPEVLQIARRTMRVVNLNIAFTAVFNLAGLSLAAFGFLPPIFAAAAQSIPDIGILANSARLLRQK